MLKQREGNAMTKINWKAKLGSRKFWAAFAA